jgi:hypothetical protein
MADSPGTLAAADDGHRMILLCVLHDACESLIDVVLACPPCIAAGFFICAVHWDDYQETYERYGQLRARLEGSRGLAKACPLTADDRQTLTEALALATSYRRNGGAAEDAALIAAYEQLGRCLAVEPVSA